MQFKEGICKEEKQWEVTRTNSICVEQICLKMILHEYQDLYQSLLTKLNSSSILYTWKLSQLDILREFCAELIKVFPKF